MELGVTGTFLVVENHRSGRNTISGRASTGKIESGITHSPVLWHFSLLDDIC